MYRLLLAFLILSASSSCSKNDGDINNPPPVEVPDIITGFVTEFSVDPLDITTPDKGTLLVNMNNTVYRVEFTAADQSAYNATVTFKSDSILTKDSRQFANFGPDIVAYTPVRENEVEFIFTEGQRKVTGTFNASSYFGGVFGQTLISQWKDSADPLKANQKARDDVAELIRRYSDKDGAGPEVAPTLLSVRVSIL